MTQTPGGGDVHRGSLASNPVSDYKSTSLAVAAGTTVRVWDASSASDVSSSTVMAKTNVSPTAISWNRNNKVAAVGLENGRVQIRYANGTCMRTLRDDDPDEECVDPVSSLSWSTGSKTLAVGSVGGRVSVHDMTTKQHVSKVIHDGSFSSFSSFSSSKFSSSKFKAVGLQHHPDDAFLAVGGKESVELYTLRLEEAKGSCVCSASAVVKSDACFSSVSVATGKPYMAAGSDKNGIVAVWDYVTETELACDKFRHAHKGSTKVALAPLEPYLLYSVGMDGILKMQDLRAPSSIASPTAMASVSSTAGISSMSIHEFSGDIALGTNDGYVYVFSGGLKSRQAKQSLFFGDVLHGEECPVLAVDWARSYHNVTLHARQMVADSERAAVTPVSTARLLDTRLGREGVRTEDVAKQTPETLVKNVVPQPSTSSANTSQSLQRNVTPLVRRASTADPWQIRAANVVDGGSDAPSSGALPLQNLPEDGLAVPAVAVKKTPSQTPKGAIGRDLAGTGDDQVGMIADAVGTSQATAVGEDLSQLILALHLDMVQMHEAQSGEIRALREEVSALKDLLAQSAKPSGDVWGI